MITALAGHIVVDLTVFRGPNNKVILTSKGCTLQNTLRATIQAPFILGQTTYGLQYIPSGILGHFADDARYILKVIGSKYLFL